LAFKLAATEVDDEPNLKARRLGGDVGLSTEGDEAEALSELVAFIKDILRARRGEGSVIELPTAG
jgi:hypothetical protein